MAHRHPSLIQLSRDHYEGLLLCLQLREPHRIIMNNWTTEESKQGHAVAQFYHDHLSLHFLTEEQSLFPLVMTHVPEGKPLVDELLREHREIERRIRQFEEVDPAGTASQLQQFGEFLEAHIRKEERQLFPLVEAKAPPHVLAAAIKEMNRDDNSPDSA
jgi:hemerythrin-like domain-containing protein